MPAVGVLGSRCERNRLATEGPLLDWPRGDLVTPDFEQAALAIYAPFEDLARAIRAGLVRDYDDLDAASLKYEAALDALDALLRIANTADDLVRQRADGLEDIFEDNFLRLSTAIGMVPVLWACQNCTARNALWRTVCGVCGELR